MRVKRTDGNEVKFKVKRATPFAKIFKTYAERVGSHVDSIKFHFDGAAIEGHDTPQQVQISKVGLTFLSWI